MPVLAICSRFQIADWTHTRFQRSCSVSLQVGNVQNLRVSDLFIFKNFFFFYFDYNIKNLNWLIL